MPTGIGARTSNMDTRYFVGAQAGPDNYVSQGVASGRTLVSFPGFGGKGSDSNLDQTSLLVWVITGLAIATVLGVHFSFGGRRLL